MGPAELHTETVGEGPTVVLAHGFTQTGRLWGGFGPLLAAHHTLMQVDLPGHAGSTDVDADLPTAGDLLAQAGGPGPYTVLGYSLGARVALHAALSHPERVSRLVLIGANPGIEDPADRAERGRHDDELADELERSGDLESFLRRWLAGPLFSGLRSPELDERRRNTPAGLASSLRAAGTGTQVPLWSRLGELAMPTLVLAGATDLRYALVGRRLADGLPNAVYSLVPGAGHATHLEQPALTARVVLGFLDG